MIQIKWYHSNVAGMDDSLQFDLDAAVTGDPEHDNDYDFFVDRRFAMAAFDTDDNELVELVEKIMENHGYFEVDDNNISIVWQAPVSRGMEES